MFTGAELKVWWPNYHTLFWASWFSGLIVRGLWEDPLLTQARISFNMTRKVEGDSGQGRILSWLYHWQSSKIHLWFVTGCFSDSLKTVETKLQYEYRTWAILLEEQFAGNSILSRTDGLMINPGLKSFEQDIVSPVSSTMPGPHVNE